MRHKRDVPELLPFIGRRGRAQLDPPEHLTQHDAHLDHRERRTQAAAVAAAKRQPRGRAQRSAEHPVWVEPVRVRVLLSARVYQPDPRDHHHSGG